MIEDTKKTYQKEDNDERLSEAEKLEIFGHPSLAPEPSEKEIIEDLQNRGYSSERIYDILEGKEPLPDPDPMLSVMEQKVEEKAKKNGRQKKNPRTKTVAESLNGTPAKSKVRRLSEIEEQSVKWLWSGRFALGKLNMFAGDPGDGKSTITLDIAARVTTGTTWPDGTPTEAGSVIILSAEDDPEDTIKPRFMAAGGNPERMHVLEAVVRFDAKNDKETESYFSLTRDVDVLAELIEHTQPRLVIIDPISAYLNGVDSHKNAELRSVLGPLSKLAADTGVCVMCVSHLNKSNSSAQYRVMGSLAFSAAARSTWVTATDKEDETRRLMLPVKNNLAPDTGGMAYKIIASEYSPEVPVVAWEKDPVHISAQQALAPDTGSKTEDAVAWLKEMLAVGDMDVKELKQAANSAGFSWRTVERAKSEIGAEAFCDGSPRYGGKWQWRLKTAKGPLKDLAALRNDEKSPF